MAGETASAPSRLPAVEGWFTDGAGEPSLLGSRCRTCGTVTFPPTAAFCRNPDCDGLEFDAVPLSRQGRVWSYTDARYQPPPPYVPPGPEHVPFAIAAVELEDEQMVVLGQVADGYSVDDLFVGQLVELVVEVLFTADGVDHVVWKWRPQEVRS